MKTGYFLVVFIIREIVCSRCPVRWLERPEGSSCYRFWPTRLKTWTEARETCQAREGELLKLNSKHEKEWVINEIKKYPVHYEWWIGLQRHPGNDSIWLWTDGTSRNESKNFIPWGSGEPNNHRDSEDCAEIWDNLLNDKNCNQPLQFICERPKDLPMKCDVDNGWDDVTSTHCFKFFGDKVTYTDAVSECSSEDASLMAINDASYQQKVTDFLDHEDKATVWLPYQFDTSTSHWFSRGVGYPGNDWWHNGVPDAQVVSHNDTLCSVMDTTLEGEKNWKPESCDASNSFMCQKSPGVCPYGYIQHKSTCYLLNTQEFMIWNEARGYCNLRSTTLLEIKNDNDWYYVLTMLKNHYSVTDIKLVWLGVSGKDSDSLKWDSGDEIDDFVTTASSGKLTTSESGTQCGFIDNSLVTGTEVKDKRSWKFGDCGGSGGAVCTVPVNGAVRIPPAQKPRYECPEGYTLNGVICFRWNPDDPVDWYTAREKCAKEGADLVTIRSEEEQKFIFRHIQSESWIGLNDRREEGNFNWLDTTAEVGVTYWFTKQPNNVEIGAQYSENCVGMLYLPGQEDHGKWVDYPCSYKAKFLCQIPAEWNIALGKIASQSSLHQIREDIYSSYGYDYGYHTVDSDNVADKAIDGCSTRSLQSRACCAITDTEDNPWWMLDLGTYYPIGKVVIHRRSEEPSSCPDCISQFRNFRLFISNTSQYDSTDASDMVYQEQRNQIPAVVILNLKNVTVGRYVRIDLPRSSATLTLCEVKVYQGESLQRSVSTTNSHCITDSTKWAGDIRHTVSGKTCQAWVLNTPHSHGYHDKAFPDGTENEAENFCRDPMGEGQPWCYTVDPDVRWEFCPVPHCTSEVGSIDSNLETEKPTDCGTGWIEDPNSGACYWLGEELLTWADAQSVCKSVGASLPLPKQTDDIDLLTGKLTNQQNGLLFWLGVYYEVDTSAWVSNMGSVSSFILDKLGSTPSTKTMCIVTDMTGNIRANSCLDRNVYSCMKKGPSVKYSTSSDDGYKLLPSSLIKTVTDSSLTTYTLKFEFKGYDGATLKLHPASDSNDGYIIRIGGNIFAKSLVSKLNSKTPKYSRLIPNLCNEDEFKDFWIQWTNGNSNGDTVDVGRGKDVGRNMFMQWTDPAGIHASSVSVATVMKTSAVYKGYWKFENEKQKKKNVEAVNLALNKSARQISTLSSISGPEKAVDGCKTNTYRSQCISHTKPGEFEPWWEVDLGQVYPIREVVIYRRGPECCTERLGYFRLIVSMFSDSTLEEDVVYKSESREPPFIMHISAKGRSGRYIKIDIPGRKEILELAEVEVYEDVDASRCGSGWLDYSTDGTCYKFSDVQMNWNNAKTLCDGLNSAMVVPKTSMEQLFLYENSLPITNEHLNSRSIWLGLHDKATEGSFQTSDGSVLAYTDWGKGEPNDVGLGEDCGALRIDWSNKAGTWNDDNCNTQLRAVCKKAEHTTTTSTTTTTTTEPPTTSATTIATTTVTEKTIILSQGDCKADWIYSPVSSSCLRIFKDTGLSFYIAASKCISLNSRLASIENGLEQDLIAEMMKSSGFSGQKWDALWTGGLDDHKEADWQWFMDSSAWHSSVRWSPGQPDNTKTFEHCANLRTIPTSYALLNDSPCETKNENHKDIDGYVCKYNLGGKKCKDGWVYNGQTDTCYILELQNRANWNDARSRCSQGNGILATIGSKSEQLFIKALVANAKGKGVWVGAHDMREEGIYQWIDGSTWISNLWAPDQPNNWKSNQHCAMLVVSGIDNALGLLQDDFCEDKYPYICAIKGCAAGWEKFEKNCYLFSLTNRGWEDAKANCESEEARLVIVDDEKEHNFLRQKVRESGFNFMWIGARYDHTYGEHRWIDGSPMTFSAWAPGRPGSATGCVDYLHSMDYLWNSHLDCVTTKGPYICEKVSISEAGLTKPPTVTTTTATATKSPTRTTVLPVSTRTTTLHVSTTTPTRTTMERMIGKCGPDWEVDPSSDFCYKFVIELVSWTEAQTKCSEAGGNLVSIVSDQEQSYITGRLQGVSMRPEAMWIGASDADLEAGWNWIDGKPFAYFNWAFGEPNNFVASDAEEVIPEGEDCAAIVSGETQYFGQWNDLSCSSERGYICKKIADTEATPIPTRPRPNTEETGIIEIYEKGSPGRTADFKSHDLYEMGVRLVDTFKFSVKAQNAFILLQNEKSDFTEKIYLVIIGGWGGRKSVLRHVGNDIIHKESGLLSNSEFRSFWISWNRTTIEVGKSDQVGTNVFLTLSGEIMDINYVSVGSVWNADSYWKIPKGDKYYGCEGAGWLEYRDSCFLVVQENKDWNEANAYCHKEGAELASIADAEEQNFLFSQLPQDTYCYNLWNDTKCNIWAKRGDCERNPVWMATNCHSACKHCLHNCRDTYYSRRKCLDWTRLGECDKNPTWMIKNCAMSCGVCQGAPTRGYWIGLHSSGMDQSYRWSDHSTVRFTNWNNHQPVWFNLKPRSCVAMFFQNGKWNDGQCTDPLEGFICKQAKMVLPITTPSAFHVGCPMENGYGYGAYCYVYIKQQKSWSDAQSNCNSLGGHLTYIGNTYTQAFVASELQNLLQDYWIGLSVANGNWTWDRSEQTKLTMTHFDKNVKVDEVTDGCFAMTAYKPVGLWKIYLDCSLKLPSICQIPREGFTTTVPTTIPSSTTPLPDCAETWQPYGHYCYKVSEKKQRWHIAQQICTHYGSSLVSLHSLEENRAVADMIGTSDFWIGLHDTDIEGVDEVTDVCFAMTAYKPVGLWKIYSDCSLKLPSICQIPREGFTTTVPTTIPSSTTPLPDCAETWQPYGHYCYKVSEKKQRWHIAQQICTHYGSSLVSIHSLEENRAVADMIGTSDNFWIGLHDTDIEGDFVWEDESPVDFLYWNGNEPNNARGIEDCAMVIAGINYWNDVRCYATKHYICKIPRGKRVITDPHNIDTFPACDDNSPDDGWVTSGEFCYFLGKEEFLTWDDAQSTCRSLGSELASVHSEEERYFLFSLKIQADDVSWIGFNDLDFDNRFSWNDGTVVDYTAWASGQPNLGRERCVTIAYDGTWHDYPCNDPKPYICKRRKDGVTIATTVASTRVIQGGCPSGFNYTLGNKCYLFSSDGDNVRWADAMDKCKLLGGHLISIHSAQEQDFLALNAYDNSNSMWLGMHDLNENGRFEWADNSRLDYTNWAPNEPSSTLYMYSKEPCVEMWRDVDNLGLWNDVKCQADRGYICSSLKDPSIPVLSSQCPEGYMFMRRSCYKVSSTKQSWDQSVDTCSLEGGQLMVVVEKPDSLVINVLTAISGQPELWVGGKANEGNVKWHDGSRSIIPVPDTVGTGCVYSSGTQLSTGTCTKSRSAVCKITTGLTSAASTVPTTYETTASDNQTYTCHNNSWLLYNEYCYAVVYEEATFTNTKCSQYGMYLASINSLNENFKIISWILHHQQWSGLQTAYPYFWIGLYTFVRRGEFPVWTDGGSVVYNNFDTSAWPTQGCTMLMLYTGKWQAVSCTDKHFYVCKGHADVATTITPTTTQMKKNKTDSVEERTTGVFTTKIKTTTETFRRETLKKTSRETGLTGGQIAGVTIGVIGFIVILGVMVYILRSSAFKKPTYPFKMPSLGFDNALFHKADDTVSIN